MRLFIAEKPELARAIVAGLGGGNRCDGYFDCGADKVTWCYGHMLKLLEPEDYEPSHGSWTMEALPIVHFPWSRKPADDPERQTQLKIILALLSKASSVVHAGDPDEEGQLLVDEVLAYANNRLPVRRLLVTDNSVNVVRRQLAALRDNAEFSGLSAAAEARYVGDRLYGLNMTRGYTLAANARGYQGVISVGRVQTPILGLVVRRCRENLAHQPVPFFLVDGLFEFGGTRFSARYNIVAGDPLDSEGRLCSPDHVIRIKDEVSGAKAKIVSMVKRRDRTPPPLPYNLLKLQIDASHQFGMKPAVVTSITQVLREKHQLITYNRSECEYLCDEQHAEAPSVLAAIAETTSWFRATVQKADPSMRGRAFNSKRVTAHTAIIPTCSKIDMSLLSNDERCIYGLIARAYVAQFWPHHCAEITEITVDVAGFRFVVRATATKVAGWKTLFDRGFDQAREGSEIEADRDDLSSLFEGQDGRCVSGTVERMYTRPPALYTITSLLSDMTSITKYLRDPRLRELVVDGTDDDPFVGGFGTPATRDAIIKALFDRGYLMERGRTIVATPEGTALYDALPSAAKYPDMTAVWQIQQKAIMAGTYSAETFIRKLVEYIADEIDRLKRDGLQIRQFSPVCQACGRPMRRIGKKHGPGFFWGCTGFAQGCAQTFDDRSGQPAQRRPQPSQRPRRRSSGRVTSVRTRGKH